MNVNQFHLKFGNTHILFVIEFIPICKIFQLLCLSYFVTSTSHAVTRKRPNIVCQWILFPCGYILAGFLKYKLEVLDNKVHIEKFVSWHFHKIYLLWLKNFLLWFRSFNYVETYVVYSRHPSPYIEMHISSRSKYYRLVQKFTLYLSFKLLTLLSCLTFLLFVCVKVRNTNIMEDIWRLINVWMDINV